MTAIPIWDTVRGNAQNYDAWLCDIWGVLHNGAAAFLPAVNACAHFRQKGGRVILVSNAPRPAAAVATQLDALGITPASYDAILTSGDVTRTLLQSMPPQAIYMLGPDRHRLLVDGLDHAFADETLAELVLCSGLFEIDPAETPERYRPHLERMAQRGLPMLCANPDLTADSGGTILFCAGSLAAIYESMGGSVTYAGKPHAAVYAEARTMLADMAGDADLRILAIGDGVNTDIRGAAGAGIDALYIASRIHLTTAFSSSAVAQLFAPYPFKPKAAMAGLVW